MRSSIPLYDALADGYEEHYSVPHRKAYDDLSWQAITDELGSPSPGRPIVDAGCGVGRWVQRLIEQSHEVVGIEQSPKMAAKATAQCPSRSFTLIESSMEEVTLPDGMAAAVLAMGSLQYTAEPIAMLRRFRAWTSPGGLVAVLVDSLVSLVLELARSDHVDDAEQRRRTRRGIWTTDGHTAEMHLFDAASLRAAMDDAGLVDVEVRGLLCGWSLLGPQRLTEALQADLPGSMDRERRWSMDPTMADLGKQLLGLARTPG
jgi:SAM-dependent methyltransferase